MFPQYAVLSAKTEQGPFGDKSQDDQGFWSTIEYFYWSTPVKHNASYWEYAIAEYEICLNDFSVGKGGTLCDITAFITGEDGEALALEDGSYWGTTVSCLDQETYFYEGVIHSMMAFRIVKGRSDYLIIAGEYGKTQTFFKGQ